MLWNLGDTFQEFPGMPWNARAKAMSSPKFRVWAGSEHDPDQQPGHIPVRSVEGTVWIRGGENVLGGEEALSIH